MSSDLVKISYYPNKISKKTITTKIITTKQQIS